MKYLYCPNCKDLRVKAWFQLSDRCSRCMHDARPIKIPNGWMTYTTYVLYVMVPAFVAIYLTEGGDYYLWLAVFGLIAMVIVMYADLSRGSAYARTKIKLSRSDADSFRRRGWT